MLNPLNKHVLWFSLPKTWEVLEYYFFPAFAGAVLSFEGILLLSVVAQRQVLT